MKSRTTWILAVLVTLVGLLVVWDQRNGTSTQQALDKAKRVLDFRSEAVTRLELAYTNRTVVLEKSGDHWNLQQPLLARADAGAVNSILSDLEFAPRDRTLTAAELKGTDLSEFGLERPPIRVLLQSKTGPITLLVGRETPTKDAVYVQIQGQPTIAITPKSLLDRLNTTVDSLRSHTAFEFTPSGVTRLELKSADHVVELARTSATTNAEPRWAIVRPLAARASQRKIGELLANLAELQIQSFVSDDAKDVHTYQLEDAPQEVTVWTGDAGKTLLFGHAPTNNPGAVYAKLKSSDSIVTVAAEPVKKFAVPINDLRDPQVLNFSPSDVTGIELLQGAAKIQLAQTAKGWDITAPEAMAADESSVENLLAGLGDLTATQFVDVAVDLDKYGLAAPMAMVTLRGHNSNTVAQLLVGGLDGSHPIRYVKRTDEPFVYGVESNAFEWLPASTLAIRARRMAELSPDQIIKLTSRKGASQVVLERDTQRKWRLVDPAQGLFDNDALQRLLDAFCQLRAEKFLREGRENLSEYGLESPGFTLTAQTADKTYTLALGNEAEPGLQYAFWSEPPLVWKAITADLATITRDFVTRTNAPAAAAGTNPPAANPIIATLPVAVPTSAVPSSPNVGPSQAQSP